LFPGSAKCFLGYVYGNAKFAIEYSDTFTVIRVIVGNNQGVDIPNSFTKMHKALFGLFAGDAGVKQEFHAICFNVNSVSITAGL